MIENYIISNQADRWTLHYIGIKHPKKCKRMAGVTGLEPAASGVTGRRSNQLSYTPLIFLVGDDGIEPPTLSV